jgi:hypothetical protein
LVFGDVEQLGDEQIDGVLVRGCGWVNPLGWQNEDLAYVQTESQAAMLGWLHGLSCPVVGRMPAAIWYRSQMPVTYWQPLLTRCALCASEAVVTNVETEARAFRSRHPIGAVYAPFSTPDRYLLASDDDWKGLAALQACAPVCLTEPHGATRPVCLVGERVIWDGEPPFEAPEFNSSLRRFAATVELNFVEFAIAPEEGYSVVAVDPLPQFEHFGEAARQEIAQAVSELLTRSGVTEVSRRDLKPRTELHSQEELS